MKAISTSRNTDTIQPKSTMENSPLADLQKAVGQLLEEAEPIGSPHKITEEVGEYVFGAEAYNNLVEALIRSRRL